MKRSSDDVIVPTFDTAWSLIATATFATNASGTSCR